MNLENYRILLRAWTEDDAEECYRYLKSPKVTLNVGKPPYECVEDCKKMIRDSIMKPEVYAIILKDTGLPIGCVGLLLGSDRGLTDKPDECEIGYWLGEPYWGQGIMPEAVNLLLFHAFIDLKMKQIWSAYYDGNDQSKRVLEKCGFHYMWTNDNVDVPLLHETRKVHINSLKRDEWIEYIRNNSVSDESEPDPDNIFPILNYKMLTNIRPTIKNSNIIVGDFSYFSDVDFEKHVTHHYDFIGDKLIIGKFCQIASGVEFVMNGANHQMNAVSTFPFYIFNGWKMERPPLSDLPIKGDTVVGNDVWIGQNVTILPGVHIGDGAVIGANSVVGCDVEPYTIVAGNPAKFIRKRFDDELIDLLLRFKWWDKSIDEIQALIPILTCSDLEKVKKEIIQAARVCAARA